MHCYNREGFGSRILSPMSLLLIKFLGEMYVDDTDLTIMQPHYTSAADVKNNAQVSTNMWAQLLNSTGGSLNPEKCYWWMVDYVCVDGEWNYAPQVEWELTIPLPDGSRHPIAQQDIRESKKMLGIWANPTGNDTKHLEEVILKKYRIWLDRSKNGHLPAKLNWMSYNFKLWAGMNYGLATLATPTNAVVKLLDKLDYEALPLLGVTRSIKKEWRNLPRSFGGIGLRNVATEQLIGWTNMLLQHYGSQTTLGNKLTASLEALQLELGCIGNPLEESYSARCILATHCWIVAIWERLQRAKLSVYMKYDELKLPRINDIPLVDLFLQEGYSGIELRRLNRCRLHLNAIFLSNLATAEGRRLEDFVLHSRVGRSSKFRFPREHPGPKDWKLWDDFWFSWQSTNGLMATTLGSWINPSHQIWGWYLDIPSWRLWERCSAGWVEYRQVPNERTTRNNTLFTPIQTWETPNQLGVPASIKVRNNSTQVVDCGPMQDQTTPPDSSASFWEFVSKQGGEWMWDHVEGKREDMSWIATALFDQSAIMVTDGSYNRGLAPNICGAGWTLVSTNSRRMVSGSFYEQSSSASSYRGKLLGLTAIHHLVAFVMEYYNVKKSSGSIHCNNKGALHQASAKRKRVRSRTKHSDLIRNIRQIKATHNIEVHYAHVKAHLDDKLKWDELTLVQKLNVHCDLLAKQAVQNAISNPSNRSSADQLLPRELAAVIVADEKQTSDTAKAIRFVLGRLEAKKFFTKRIDKKMTLTREVWDGQHNGLS